MQLNDVAVLITGGGSGLGAATARAMAAKGAKIGVIDQNKENAEKVAAEVKGVALHADVTDEEAIKAAIAKAEAAHGIARVLMNCAGIGGSQRTVGKDGVYPLAKFVRIINVNLLVRELHHRAFGAGLQHRVDLVRRRPRDDAQIRVLFLHAADVIRVRPARGMPDVAELDRTAKRTLGSWGKLCGRKLSWMRRASCSS